MGKAEAGFAVLYRWTVDPAHEGEFIERWVRVTDELRRDHGALGSCLSRAANGDFVAFARWSSEKARDDAFAARSKHKPSPGILRFTEEKFAVVADLLTRV